MVKGKRKISKAAKRVAPKLHRRTRGLKTSVFGVSKRELDNAARRIFNDTDVYYSQTRRAQGTWPSIKESQSFTREKINDYSVFKASQNAMDLFGIKKNRKELLEEIHKIFRRAFQVRASGRPSTIVRGKEVAVGRKDSVVAASVREIEKSLGRIRSVTLINLISKNQHKIYLSLNKRFKEEYIPKEPKP